MSNVTAVREEFDAAIEAALKVVLFERAIASDPSALNATLKAEERFLLSVRDLKRAVDDMPLEKQPREWHK